MRLALLISEILTAARELKNKLFHEVLEKEYGSKADIKADDTADVVTTPAKETITEPEPLIVTTTIPETEVVEQLKGKGKKYSFTPDTPNISHDSYCKNNNATMPLHSRYHPRSFTMSFRSVIML